MHRRTLISFLAATGLHAAGFAALDAGWLLPSPKSEPVACSCEVELVSMVPETPAVPLPMAPEASPIASQSPEPPPAPVAEPMPVAAKPEPEPPPPKPLPPEPMVERPPEPKPEPPPPPKPIQRPAPGPTLESKPRPVVPAPPPKRVATAKPPSSTTTGSPGGSAAGGGPATAPSGPTSPATGGHGTGASLAFPSYLSNPKPYYPARAKREKQQGVVLLNVDVNADGKVTHVEIGRSSGHSLLDESALNTVRRWRFIPARLGDRPIDSRVQVPIRFQFEH